MDIPLTDKPPSPSAERSPRANGRDNRAPYLKVESLKVVRFKSYTEESFSFGDGFQVLVGRNGMGKTNLLDAVYYLGLCRSAFPLRDVDLVRHGEEFFRLEARVSLEEGPPMQVKARVQPGMKKEFERDGKVYDSLSAHIGQIPVVLIAPNDSEIINGFSETRRRFMDQTLCQVDPAYLSALASYNRLLLQRNAYLKSVMHGQPLDSGVLDALDSHIEPAARILDQSRRTFARALLQEVGQVYQAISLGSEEPDIRYDGALAGTTWTGLMGTRLKEDLRTGRTTAGLHRDDLLLLLDGYPARRFSSQGQMKSFVFALKLAQFRYIAAQRNRLPLLLLDDLFDKLDHHRVEALLDFLVHQDRGQVFITDTEEGRVAGVLERMNQPFRIFQLTSSTIRETRNG